MTAAELAAIEDIAEEVASMIHDDALFYAVSRRGGPDWREPDERYALIRANVYRRLGLVEVAEILDALRDAHRHDSAADAVEYVSDLVGWNADDDEVLQAEGCSGLQPNLDPQLPPAGRSMDAGGDAEHHHH